MRESLTAAVACLLAGACAHTPFVCPAKGGGAWTEIVTEHYALKTDLPESQARAASEELERIYGAFLDLAFRSKDPPRKRMDIILFRHLEDYKEIAPAGAGAHFTTLDVDETPTLVLWGELTRTMRHLFQHELTHRFIHHHMPQAPLWLHEGLAEYYGTMRVSGSQAVIGETLPDRNFTTHGESYAVETPEGWRVHISFDDLPSAREILTADKLWLYTHMDKGFAFYLGAWALVHMLYNSADTRDRFQAFMNGLAGGETGEEAWKKAGLPSDLDRLHQQFLDHVRSGKSNVVEAPYTPRAAPAPDRVSPLSDAEVHVLWARIRGWFGSEDMDKTKKDLEEAVERAPDDPEARYFMAHLDLHRGRIAEGESGLRRALSKRAKEPRYWQALGEALFEEELALPGPRRRLDRAEEALRRLADLSPGPLGLQALARFYAETGRPDEGLPFAKRAVAEDSGCWCCLDTLALILFEKDLSAEAAALQRRAMNLVPDPSLSNLRPLATRLYHYERAARSTSAPAGASAPQP